MEDAQFKIKMVNSFVSPIDDIVEPYGSYNHVNAMRCKGILRNLPGHYTSRFVSQKDERRLRTAAAHNDIERIQELLEKGVDPNQPDESGRTALHLASCRGFSCAVQKLLAYNANCNAVDKLGNTPLHLAVCTTSKTTVDLLLKAGCNICVKGNNGCTPLQLAQSKLWLMQRHKGPDYNSLKAELNEVIDMMKKLVTEKSEEAQLVNAFSTRLSLRHTSEEVVDDVKQLLESLGSLNLNKSLAKSGSSQLQKPDETDENECI